MTIDRRTRTPLAFGQGVARNEGLLVSQPGSVEDVRNLILTDGRATLRSGHQLAAAIQSASGGAVTHIIGGRALRSEGIGVVVTYASATGRVSVYRVESDMSAAERIGTWFTVDAESEPPRVWLAESFGRMFMAHDDPAIQTRAETFIYDFLFSSGEVLRPLTGDFDAQGEHSIRFRGVVSHLDYLFGWGYGTEFEDRPELVRASLPGQPNVFDHRHYFIAGDRRDPVLQCVPGAQNLVVFKGAETHGIFGYDRRTFGIQIIDPLHGLLHPGLAVNVSGSVFFWSGEGPKVTNGEGPSTALESPLDLLGFEPEDLVARGSEREMNSWYVPGDRCVVFAFGRRAYVLSVKSENWKWSYWPLAFTPYSAFMLFETQAAGDVAGPPTGYPEWVDEAAGGTYVVVDVLNVDHRAGDTLELWRAESGTADWSLIAIISTSPQAEQKVLGEGLTPGVEYDGALRYRRGTRIAEPYQGPPGSWPAISRGTFETTLNPPVVGKVDEETGGRFSGVLEDEWTWFRTADDAQYHQFRVRPWVGAGAGQTIKIHRQTVVDGELGASTVIDELVEGVDFDLGNLGPDGGFTYRAEDPPIGALHRYSASSENDGVESPRGAPVWLWAGPQPQSQATAKVPHTMTAFFETDRLSYELQLGLHSVKDATSTSAHVDFADDWDDDGEVFTEEPDQARGSVVIPDLYDAGAAHQGPPDFGEIETVRAVREVALAAAPPAGSTMNLYARYRVVKFGVTDYSQWFQMIVTFGSSGGGYIPQTGGGGPGDPENPDEEGPFVE